MACDCKCGGEYMLQGRSTPNGFGRSLFTITKLSNNGAGNPIIALDPGAGQTTTGLTNNTTGGVFPTGPTDVAIDASGNVTTPTGGLEVYGATSNDAIPDGTYVFSVTYETGCVTYIRLRINEDGNGDPSPGTTYVEFLEDDPTP